MMTDEEYYKSLRQRIRSHNRKYGIKEHCCIRTYIECQRLNGFDCVFKTDRYGIEMIHKCKCSQCKDYELW